jgi:hypothetical protein
MVILLAVTGSIYLPQTFQFMLANSDNTGTIFQEDDPTSSPPTTLEETVAEFFTGPTADEYRGLIYELWTNTMLGEGFDLWPKDKKALNHFLCENLMRLINRLEQFKTQEVQP